MENIRNNAFEDYKQGVKIADIAERYGVPFNTVKSWARRYWKLKQGEKCAAVSTGSNQRVQPRPHGTPKGSQNNLIHGAYANTYFDMQNEKSRDFVKYIECAPEQILRDMLVFYTLRERRLLKLAAELDKSEYIHTYSVTYKIKKEIGGKIHTHIIHITSQHTICALIERELTKISAAKIELATLFRKLPTAKKISSGVTAKIYSMAETAEKFDERISKIIQQIQGAVNQVAA